MKAIKIIRFCSLFGLSVLLFSNAFAQQKPQYTQYILNQYILNPALSGIENYTDVKISHRHQWVGIDDAPVTTYLTIQGPIGKQDNRTTATTLLPDMDGQNQTGKEAMDDYIAPPAHHGIGAQIVNDAFGPFNNFSFYATYAYHMPLNNKTSLSAGLGLGFSKLSLDNDKLFWGNANPVDPAVYTNADVTKPRFDANVGVWLYSYNYFIGASVQQLLPQAIDFSDNGILQPNPGGKMVPHIFATAGYKFFLNEDVSLLPSVMVKMVQPEPVQVDINAKLTFQDLVWIGASYRGGYGYAAMAGFNASNMFTISYSYDYTTTRLNTVSNGTHEILFGFALGNKYSTNTCPRNAW
ncbi:PorP/SprF family type IX secretion system membrane protein [Ferruginibacter albus]|uniref:PorP/SprF family type IX secretion system membrane protein n=1 Tax=Ferruginibacter albus TaxID=2875540 RepID=UPI001CC6BACC|nr:type IX secretion system membrane protein PorP/SprF [Ferruginibacter albus]UAY51208.1 type IX secretion system membrane protein PorP/SprF [Ferruginibacter albus]